MAIVRKFIKVCISSGRTGWITLFSLFAPLVGTAVLVLYLQELEDLLDSGASAYLFGLFLLSLLLVGTSFIPSYVLAIVCGWLLGFTNGLLFSLSGIVLAAILGYWLSSLLVCDKFKNMIESSEKYKELDSTLKNKKLKVVALISLMRLSPLFPFAMTNVVMASLKINMRAFITGTFAGMLPRTIVAVLFGSQLQTLKVMKPADSWGLAVGLLATLIFLYTISRYAGRSLRTA